MTSLRGPYLSTRWTRLHLVSSWFDESLAQCPQQWICVFHRILEGCNTRSFIREGPCKILSAIECCSPECGCTVKKKHFIIGLWRLNTGWWGRYQVFPWGSTCVHISSVYLPSRSLLTFKNSSHLYAISQLLGNSGLLSLIGIVDEFLYLTVYYWFSLYSPVSRGNL